MAVLNDRQRSINRRRFIECFSAAGLGLTLLPGALAAIAQDAATITLDMLQAAQQIAGLSFTPDEQQRLLDKLNGARGYVAGFAQLRGAALDSTQPAIVFNPVPPGKTLPSERRSLRLADESGRARTGGSWTTSAASVATIEVIADVVTVHGVAAGETTFTVTREGLVFTGKMNVVAEGATLPNGTTLWSLGPC